MNRDIALRALAGLFIIPLPIGIPLFLSAGTLDYWQGWLFIVVFDIATSLHGLYLAIKDPALLERRKRVGPFAEKRLGQRIFAAFMILAWIVVFVIAGLDYRFSWSHIPVLAVLAGNFLVVLSYVIIQAVVKANSFASATIEISEGQKISTTGPYAVVRHPMYSSNLVLAIGAPLALGSIWAELVVLAFLPALVFRILDEEKVLAEQLDGYIDYCKKVKFRLIPGVY